MNVNKLKVEPHQINERLDKVMREILSERTRTYLQMLIDEGFIKVNGKDSKSSYRLKEGDEISYILKESEPLALEKEEIPLDVCFEDNDFLVINKPQGMVVHPAGGHSEGTLVNALLAHCGDTLSGINGVKRPGIVHRLDKDTSGLILVCKNDLAHQGVSKQFAERTIKRIYTALVYGVIREDAGKIHAPLARDTRNRQKMAVNLNDGKEAITKFRVLERFEKYTLVEASLVTGRTHQIRVHFAYIGYPIVRDKIYGPSKKAKASEGQLLHATELAFIHPTTKKEVHIISELPPYFVNFLTSLRTK